MKRGDNSKSLLREPDLTWINDNDGELDRILARGNDGKLLSKKKTIGEDLNRIGFDRHLIFNAIYLQNFSLDEIKSKMQGLSNFLKEKNLRGILEFHANDSTQQSFHFHYWTNDDHWEVKRMIGEYILEHEWTSSIHVDIQGLFVRTEDLETDEERAEAFEDFKNVPKAKDVVMTTKEQKIENKRENFFALLKQSVDEVAKGRILNARVRNDDSLAKQLENAKKAKLAHINGMSPQEREEHATKTLARIKSRFK